MMMEGLWRTKQPSSSNGEGASQNADVVIAIMGVTGAGKSSFIACVTGRKDIKVGHELYSETSEVQAYRFSYGSTNYVLVDTPGFDDSSMSNEEIATKIVQWLESSYRSGIRLNGIIYIHDITKPRMQGSAYQNMRLFRQLCGDDALGNVILATSFWDQITKSVGAKREHELKNSEDFWANMVAKGSEVVRIKPDRSICLKVLERIAAKNKVDLLVQTEMVVEKKKLKDTTVGKDTRSSEIRKFEETLEKEKKAEKKRLQGKLEEAQKAHKKDMEQLRTQQKKAQREEQQRQRRVEKEHKRNVREDRWQLQQQRREIEGPVWQMRVERRGCRDLYMLTAFWLLLATSLTGNVIADSPYGAPTGINYAMFSIVWAWLTVLIGIASYFLEFIPTVIVLFWDISAAIFTFCAAVELAAILGIHSCFNADYLLNNNLIAESSNSTRGCQELQATTAFLWFIFFSFIITTVLNIRRVAKWGTMSTEADRFPMSYV